MSRANWQKKKVWVVTAELAAIDMNGEVLNWSDPFQEYYANTLEEAIELKEKLLNGEDEYYRDWIENCYISDEPEERECLSFAIGTCRFPGPQPSGVFPKH